MQADPIVLVQIWQGDVRRSIATERMLQVVRPFQDLLQLLVLEPIHLTRAVVCVHQVHEHLVHAHDLRGLARVRHVVQDVLEHVAVVRFQSLGQETMGLGNHRVWNLREHLAPVTGHHAVKGPVTDESWIAEVDAVPVVVSVPEVLPQRSVFHRVGGFWYLGFGDHVQVFTEQEIPRVVGQVVLVFIYLFGQGSHSSPGFFDRFRGGGGVLQHGIERLACFTLFADEFDVAVEDVVLLALNDFQVVPVGLIADVLNSMGSSTMRNSK